MKYYAVLLCALPLCAQQLVKIKGDGLVVLGHAGRVTEYPTVRAIDAAGRPMPNVPITWTSTPAQTAGGLVRQDNVTNEDGYAEAEYIGAFIPPGTPYVQWKVTATAPFGSAVFTASTVPSRTPRVQVIVPSEVTGPAGGTATLPIRAVLQSESFGIQGVPNAALRVETTAPEGQQQWPTANCGGPNGVAMTNSQGIAECYLTFGPVTGTGSAVAYFAGIALQRFSFVVTAGQNCNVRLASASQTFGPGGGSGAFNLDAITDCFWVATTPDTWISITSPTNARGSGPGRVAFTVAANTSNTERTGTITVAGQTFTVTQAGVGGEQPLTFTTGTILPQATPGADYSVTLTASGGRPPYTWTEAGILPANLTLNRTTGVLSGRPPAAGTFQIPITVRDSAGRAANRTFTLTISTTPSGGGSLSFSTAANLPPATLQAVYSQTIRATGGCENPFRATQVTLDSGILPPGLSGQSAQGGGFQIIGNPTQAGTYSFTLRAEDGCGGSTTRTFNLTVSGSSQVASPIAVSSTAITFRMQRGQTLPGEQSLAISSGTPIPIQIAPASDGNWLDVSSRQSQTNTTVQVRVTNAGLPAGRYSGSITITGDAPNSPLTVPVILEVTEPLGVVVSPTSLNFEYTPGSSTFVGTQLLNVSTPPGLSIVMPFTVEAVTISGGAWLNVSPRSGTAPASLAVNVNPAGLGPGTYSGTIAVQPAFNAPVVFVSVTLTVAGATPVINSVVNAASFTGNAVAPGEIVTIFGASMGPSLLQNLRLTPAGTVDTTISDVRVWFDDQPSPLIYVSATQLSAIVPYGIGGRTTTRLSVEYRGVRSPVREIPLLESAPGVFTLSGGTGQAAVLNEDNTVNTASNAARAGSIVTLFATGEGQTSPVSVDGSITASDRLTQPILPVQVTVGGQPAEVLYAGSAPGQVAGLMQVNARIPASVGAGTAVPVAISVGSTTSQAGVTIAVRP